MTCYYPSQYIVPQLKSLCESSYAQACNKQYNNVEFINQMTWPHANDKFDNNEKKILDSNFSPLSLPMISDMKYEANRLKSFENIWPVSFIKPEDCASVGLFYLGEEDKVQCAFCNVIISSWENGDKPIAEHLKYCSMCPYLLRQDVGNVPISGQNGLQHWQIQNSHPERSSIRFVRNSRFPVPHQSFQTKFSSMSCFDKRLQTFSEWPENQSVGRITPSNLAESGLFYSGVTDVVTCFCCGGQMGSWSPTDDPWVEHAKHFPTCPFVKSIKGTAFIAQVQSGDISNIQEPSTSHASAAYNEESPKENYTNICEKLEAMEVAENKGANNPEEKFLCKICMEVRIRVAFIPCGHSLACPTCAKELKNCPLCRKPIQSAIRLYFD